MKYFKKSLFIFGKFGDNDYLYMWLSGKTVDFVNSAVPLVVDTIRSALEVHNTAQLLLAHQLLFAI